MDELLDHIQRLINNWLREAQLLDQAADDYENTGRIANAMRYRSKASQIRWQTRQLQALL